MHCLNKARVDKDFIPERNQLKTTFIEGDKYCHVQFNSSGVKFHMFYFHLIIRHSFQNVNHCFEVCLPHIQTNG